MAKYRATKFFYNLDQVIFPGVGPYDIPEIFPEKWVPCEYVDFRKAVTLKNKENKGVHFFLDDYRFESVWHNWKRYGNALRGFEAVMTPDFSLFSDWPKAMQIFNHYRKHFIGRWLQESGVRVYPTICWSDQSSFDWCFDGEPKHSCVAVSAVGTQTSDTGKKMFLDGYNAMMDKLEPETIIFYGNVPKECYGNIVSIKSFQDHLKVVIPDGR